MSLFKRLSITLFSCLDGVVNDIENHDALIEAAIEVQSKKIASAKYQLLQLSCRLKSISSEITQLDNQQSLWRKRALAAAEENQEKALVCLQRKRDLQRQLERTNLSEQEYIKACEILERDINNSESELNDFKQKRALLKAKQSSNDVLQRVESGSRSNSKEMEKTFACWEANLSEKNIFLARINNSDEEIDQLEKDYLKEENQLSLKQELSELMSEHTEKQGEHHE